MDYDNLHIKDLCLLKAALFRFYSLSLSLSWEILYLYLLYLFTLI